jgi:hypothetical protein
MKQSQARLEEANKKKIKLDTEKEFYKGKPMPDSLKAQVRENEKEIKAQQAAVDSRVKEMEDIRTRFAEERKRYLELTGKNRRGCRPCSCPAPAAVPAATPAPAPAPTPAPAPAAAAAKPAEKK